jgi:hypothetical protein
VATTAQGNTGEIGGRTIGRDSDQQDVTGRSIRRNFFDLNQNPTSAEGGGNSPLGPLTGENFVNWSDRLRDVEEMLDQPDLRGEVARIRDRARSVRSDVKRHAKTPQWDLVRLEISGPLMEVRDRVAEELARREKADALVPIDRDPVPSKFSDLVKRYYEKLGSE